MTIPTDHIKFSDDGKTAWWVVPEPVLLVGGFEITVECPHTRTLTVSVVPGMVLPIVSDLGPVLDTHHVRVTGGGIAWLTERIDNGGWRYTEIDLPSAAAPGMTAVKLEVHR